MENLYLSEENTEIYNDKCKRQFLKKHSIFALFSINVLTNACFNCTISLFTLLLFQFEEEQQQTFSLQREVSIFLAEPITFNML